MINTSNVLNYFSLTGFARNLVISQVRNEVDLTANLTWFCKRGGVVGKSEVGKT